MTLIRSLAAAVLAAAPSSLALADLTAPQVPPFRGAESTAYAGWSDWSATANGVAAPDDPATTIVGSTIVTSDGPSFAGSGGVACVSAAARVQLGYGSAQSGPVTEVVVQVAGTGLDSATMTLAYNIPFSPDPDYAGPAEVIDLAPGEKLYRFRTSARGFGAGTLAPITGFVLLLDSDQGICLDEVQLDVRHILEGEFDPQCSSPPNSLLLVAGLDAYGSSDAAANDLTLTATGIPAGAFGIFIVSDTPALVPCPGGCAANQGNLCLGGTIARVLPVLQAGGDLSFSAPLDLTALPFTPAVAVTPGSTWYFQGWYRDSNPAATSNMTSSLGVQFR